MDYSDMAESLSKHKLKTAEEEMVDLTNPLNGFYDGCTKIDWEFDDVCVEMDRHSTVRYLSGEEGKKYLEKMTGKHKGTQPFILEHVKIVRDMLGYKVPVVS